MAPLSCLDDQVQVYYWDAIQEDRGGGSQNAEQLEDSSRSVASTCSTNMAAKCMQPGAAGAKCKYCLINFALT